MSEPKKRFTVDLEERLHHEARVESVKRGVPLSEIIRAALKGWLKQEAKDEKEGSDNDR